MKIGSMTFDELIKVRARIEAEIEMRVASERRQLLAAMSSLRDGKVARGGRSPGSSSTAKGRKLPPRYRNPKNPQETWAGRGLTPRWLVAALKSGKKLEAFAIK